MLVWAGKSEHILIDAGILFPHEDCFDLHYLIPDYSKLEAPKTLIITHGHEDHLGAVIHVVERYPEIEIWAPPFAGAILRQKFNNERVSHKINIYDENKVFELLEWEIHPIRVNHSIPQTFGLLLVDKEKRFCAFHVSDFKCNLEDSYEKSFDFKKLKQLSFGIKKRFLFSDSTSITSRNEKTPQEKDLLPSFENIISKAEGRVFFTLFSSNIERIQNILEATLKDGRKLVPYGRSMNFYLEMAQELNLIKDYDLAYKNPDSVNEKNKNIVVLVSGCQGDLKSTLRRLAWSEDSSFKLVPGDTFVFSSKAIPGNEKKINTVINKLYEQGCKVLTSDQYFVHVSGHAGKEDTKLVLEHFAPTDFIPIHGDSAFLHENCSWVNQHFPQVKTEVLLNHYVLSLFSDNEVSFISEKAPRPIMIHGRKIPIEPEAVNERRKLATTGLIMISVKLDTLKNQKIKIITDTMGLPFAFQNDSELEDFLQDYLKANKIREREKYEEDLRVAIRRFYEPRLGYKPVVMLHFI